MSLTARISLLVLWIYNVAEPACGDKGGIPHWQASLPGLEANDMPPRYRHLYIRWWRDLQEDLSNCGQRQWTSNPNSRIIGGVVAPVDKWPWMVSLYSKLIQQHWCAGTLVTRQWVVTAAHCFNGPFAGPSGWSVHVGKQNVSGSADDKFEQVRTIAKLIKNSGFREFASKFAFDNDIALIKLDRPIVVNRQASPICLQPKGNVVTPGQMCTVTGYGVVDLQNIPFELNVLHEARVPLIDKRSCAEIKGYMDKITDNMLCAGYQSGDVDTCYGDSGGPIQIQIGNKWHLIGVTSWGGDQDGYDDCAQSGQPGVYTDLSKYTNWIYTQMFWDNIHNNLHDNGHHGQH